MSTSIDNMAVRHENGGGKLYMKPAANNWWRYPGVRGEMATGVPWSLHRMLSCFGGWCCLHTLRPDLMKAGVNLIQPVDTLFPPLTLRC